MIPYTTIPRMINAQYVANTVRTRATVEVRTDG
jgi:hypothetical protein